MGSSLNQDMSCIDQQDTAGCFQAPADECIHSCRITSRCAFTKCNSCMIVSTCTAPSPACHRPKVTVDANCASLEWASCCSSCLSNNVWVLAIVSKSFRFHLRDHVLPYPKSSSADPKQFLGDFDGCVSHGRSWQACWFVTAYSVCKVTSMERCNHDQPSRAFCVSACMCQQYPT